MKKTRTTARLKSPAKKKQTVARTKAPVKKGLTPARAKTPVKKVTAPAPVKPLPPAAPLPAPTPATLPAPVPAPAPAPTPTPTAATPGKKILLVDDDAVILAVYGKKLAQAGFAVTTAVDGMNALVKLQAERPDLVILDMMMPKLSGVEVLKFIRAQSGLASIPVAIFTNAFMDELAQAAVEIGVQQTVIKAECTPSKLITVANELLAVGPAAMALPQSVPAPVDVNLAQRELEAAESSASAKARQDFIRDAPVMIAELRELYQAFRKSPDLTARAARLGAFYRQVHYVTAIAGLACYHHIALISSVFEALLFELEQKPELISPSSLRTIATTLDFLGVLFAKVRDALPEEPLVGQVQVLIVDDDAVTNRVAIFALQRAHLQARATENPLDALELLAQTRYDLILLDIEMPQMSGFDFCKKLRALPGYEKTPVIYVTVHTDFENRAKGILSGGSDLIAKPFFPIELAVKAVMHLIKSHLPAFAPGQPVA